ncbi:hypothetical protein MRX96_011713 [Rhipicephalus microplus]
MREKSLLHQRERGICLRLIYGFPFFLKFEGGPDFHWADDHCFRVHPSSLCIYCRLSDIESGDHSAPAGSPFAPSSIDGQLYVLARGSPRKCGVYKRHVGLTDQVPIIQ